MFHVDKFFPTFFESVTANAIAGNIENTSPRMRGSGNEFFWSPRSLKTLQRSVSQRRHVEKIGGAKKNRANFKMEKFSRRCFRV